MAFRYSLVAPLLVAACLSAPALSQQAPSLMYSQPLSPAAVASVQERLRTAGTYTGRVDGVWGPDSQAALERFQVARGLVPTPQLNPATAQVLGLGPSELMATGPAAAVPGPAAVAGPMSPTAVRTVQQRLRALNYYNGPVDGAWGAGTQAAMERFQQGRGLQVTGQLNPTTAQALGLDSSYLGAGR